MKSVRAVSGNPGREEYEKDVGPIPDGKYLLSPNIVRGVVNKLQQGTCGALGIESGIQEIRSTDNSPCADPPNHYCTVSCPTSDHPAQKCFTPMDCWGSLRIRIQGSKTVETPTVKKSNVIFFTFVEEIMMYPLLAAASRFLIIQYSQNYRSLKNRYH